MFLQASEGETDPLVGSHLWISGSWCLVDGRQKDGLLAFPAVNAFKLKAAFIERSAASLGSPNKVPKDQCSSHCLQPGFHILAPGRHLSLAPGDRMVLF